MIVLVAAIGVIIKFRQPAVTYPITGWETGTPEDYGFDSAALAKGLIAMQQRDIPIHSLMVIRDGKSLVDATFYPYDRTNVHDVASVTKSLMTTLIGIAIDQGKIDLDKTMVSFFPDRTIANLDERKERINVRHLVSMSSGLDCTAESGEKTQAEMVATQDWIQFALDLPMSFEPGTHFSYCSPGMHLLSAILQEATGMTTQEFSRTNLFEPLGIEEVYWPADPQGYSHGWGDVGLYPQDMARIGYLFLHGGRWGDQQIVSKEWVEQATKRQMDASPYSSEDYGFGWWISSPEDDVVYFSATGRRGQQVLVIPAWDMVLVTTGGGFELPDIEKYIAPTIKDLENPLPANPEGVTQLQAALVQISQPPTAHEVAPLPETAAIISGKNFVFDENPRQVRFVRLDFDAPDSVTFTIDVGHEKESRVTRVGLDGLYRNSTAGRPVIARGSWLDDETFSIEYSEGPGLSTYNMSLHFSENQVEFEINIPGLAGHPVVGRLEE